MNVANDHEVCFQSMTFAIGLESVDGSVDAKIVAQSSEKICGGMKAVDWVEIKGNWNHLQIGTVCRLMCCSGLIVII